MNKLHASLPVIVSFLLVSGCGGNGAPQSNGESIYRTGKDSIGTVIEADVDRESLSDRSMILSCEGCHGAERKGAKSLIPDFGPYTAPDISRRALLSDRLPMRPGYDATSLRRAITEGKYPSGKSLHYPMPRWNMSGKNLDDLITYLLND